MLSRVPISMFDATVLKVVYGIEVSAKDDRYHLMAERALEISEDVLTPGRNLAEVLPFLLRLPAWMPGGRFRRSADQAKHEIQGILSTLFQAGKDCMVI